MSQTKPIKVKQPISCWIKPWVVLICIGILLIPVFINIDLLQKWSLGDEKLQWTSIAITGVGILSLLIATLVWLIKSWKRMICGLMKKTKFGVEKTKAKRISLGLIGLVMALGATFSAILGGFWFYSIIDGFSQSELSFDQKLLFIFNAHVSHWLENDSVKDYWLKTSFWKLNPDQGYLIATITLLVLGAIDIIYQPLAAINKQPKSKAKKIKNDDQNGTTTNASQINLMNWS